MKAVTSPTKSVSRSGSSANYDTSLRLAALDPSRAVRCRQRSFTQALRRQSNEHCDLKLFPSSYFHAVTCRGIARVAMKVTDVDTMNKKIDTLLEKAKEEHKEKQCLKEKTFYYNATSLIFLKYDLDGGDVAY
ncbi:hypothetical protein QR680_006477 [Steinernema hermaphroditum]|uniref:Uncharacterized protein n=1 Tax=Steinernema hermaphroditum TaxID=289476 RepID=A0AA39HX23_9BILA|nr:hypothetical protein QR680_006477 [Steinernema hermaphroditum]